MGANVIARRPVTLSPEEADLLCQILANYTRERFAHATRTKSPAIRQHCHQTAGAARQLEAAIVRRLYTQVHHTPECNIAVDDHGEYINCYRPIGGCTCGAEARTNG